MENEKKEQEKKRFLPKLCLVPSVVSLFMEIRVFFSSISVNISPDYTPSRIFSFLFSIAAVCFGVMGFRFYCHGTYPKLGRVFLIVSVLMSYQFFLFILLIIIMLAGYPPMPIPG